jgi:hypothetical protein
VIKKVDKDTTDAAATDLKAQMEAEAFRNMKKKTIPTFDISPKIVRQFRIYNI